MSDTPKGADVIVSFNTPAGPVGAIAQGLFVEAEEQRRIDHLRKQHMAKLLHGLQS